MGLLKYFMAWNFFQSAVYGVGEDWDEVAFNQEGQACAEGLLPRAFCFPGLRFHITTCDTFAFFAETCFKSSWVVCACLPPAERAALSGWTNAQQWARRDEKGDLQADTGAAPAGHHHCVGERLHLRPGAAAQSRDWKSREESSGAQGKKGTRLLCYLLRDMKAWNTILLFSYISSFPLSLASVQKLRPSEGIF